MLAPAGCQRVALGMVLGVGLRRGAGEVVGSGGAPGVRKVQIGWLQQFAGGLLELLGSDFQSAHVCLFLVYLNRLYRY